MKLRELGKPEKQFQYHVTEYDIFPGLPPKRRQLLVECNHTSMRRLQLNCRHEQLVGGEWYIISPDQFKSIIFEATNKIITRKKTGLENSKLPQPLDTRIVMSDHFQDRLVKRFGVETIEAKKFVESVLKGHKVVQGSEFYNTHRWKDYRPSDLCICNLEKDIIVVGSLNKNNFVLITTYRAKNCKWFLNWFEDNYSKFHEAPTLDQFFHGKSK